jgi:hypothetical protein
MLTISCAIASGACGRIGFDGAADRADASTSWWNDAWAYRIPIAIRNDYQETFAAFPVRIRLDAERLPDGLARADGDDLRFVDADQRTVLPHEVEVFAPAGSELWVGVPELAAETTKTIWLYVGNPAATAAEQPDGVWPAETYRLVLHMADARDSTANGNDPVDNATTSAAGVIGPARGFATATQSHYFIADAPSLHPLSIGVTISSWQRHQGFATKSKHATIARPTPDGTSADDFFLGTFEGALYLEPSTQLTDRVIMTGGTIVEDAWYHLAFVVQDNLVAKAYVDGAFTIETPLDAALKDSARPIVVGADIDASTGDTPNDDWVDGTLDEIRIETAARSPAWVAAQYRSMTDAIQTYGPVETRP